MQNDVVGRFAPSPSGRMHAGNVFSALMAWLAVRSANGRLVLRIEDLDPRASRRDYAQTLIDDLAWLGLTWDEGPYYQSDRIDLYREAVSNLVARGLTYPCFCTRAELHAASAPHASDGTYVYAGTCANLTPSQIKARSAKRNPATRLRVPCKDDPAGTITFNDLVFGPRKETLAQDCGDFLIQRSDGIMAYQLAVVVDDANMGINLVVRGHDLLMSSPRQIYLQRLLGYSTPTYAHVPLLLAPSGRRLSKRDHDMDLGVLRERDTSPSFLLGKLASYVGLAEVGERVSAEQLIERFSWTELAAVANQGDIICC